MSDVTIKKMAGDCTDAALQCKVYCFGAAGSITWQQTFLFETTDIVTITNFCSLDFDLKSPVGGFPIPELRDTCNILVKAEGNSLGISLSFTIKEESACCSIFTPGACNAAQVITTVQQQIDFWLNTFQPNSIEDAYFITVDGIERVGVVRGMTLTKSASSPIIYNARIDFLAGSVVAGES